MNLLISYIDESAIFWAGIKFDETNLFLNSTSNKSNDINKILSDLLHGKLEILESGLIRRNIAKSSEQSTSSSDTTETSNDNASIATDSETTNNETYYNRLNDENKVRLSYDTGVSFISSELTTDLEIELPFSDKKKAAKVIPFQIQDKLPYDLPESHSAIHLSSWSNEKNNKYFYTSISKEEISKILKLANDHNILICSMHPEIYVGNVFFSSLFNTIPNKSMFILEKNESLLSSYALDCKFLGSRDIKVTSDKNISNLQVNAQLGISYQELLSTDINQDNNINTINIYNLKSSNKKFDLYQNFNSPEFNYIQINYDDYFNHTKNNLNIDIPSYFKVFIISSIIDIVSRDKESSITNYQLSKNNFLNIRTAEYRYKAPYTELKNSFFNEIVPFSLLAFFGILGVLLSELFIPIKEINLNKEKLNLLASQALSSNVPYGSELVYLEEKVYELENQLGDLSITQSLLAVEWLNILSKNISSQIPLEIDSISISTKGLSFRGTVPDYPSSGRVSSALESLKSSEPQKFCDTQLKTEDVAIGVSSKQIRGEINLCE